MEGFANAGIATDDLTAARDLVDEAIGHARAGEAAETEESALKASDTLFEVEKDLRNHQFAAVLGIGTIAVIVLWAVLKPKPLAFLPGPLIAIVATTLLAFFLTLPVAYVNVPDSLLGSLHPVNDPAWWSLPWGAVLVAGGTFALVASAETLLCAVAVDSTGKGPRTNYDRELLAQGVGNTIAGLLGALPMTGVIVRSTANIDAGAKTRWSAVLHGFWLLLFVGFLTSLLKLVPTSALAGILVYTGYKLVAPQALWKLWNVDPWEAMICVIVVAVIVIEDLLVGVGVGVVLSAIKLLATFARLDIDVVCDGDCDRKQIVTLRGAATFVRLPKLAAVLEDMPGNAELHVDLHDLVYIDHACLELLTNWADRHKKQGGSLVLDWESMHAKFKEDAPLTRAVTPREAVATVTTGESAVAVAER
ncbi:MAG: solute carrier family 23 protein [Planctomycetota bacterium]